MACMFACETLRRLIDDRGISVRKLSGRLGDVSPSTIGRWLTGEVDPSFSDAIRLAEFFGVDLETFRQGATKQDRPRPARFATVVDFRDEAVMRRYFP